MCILCAGCFQQSRHPCPAVDADERSISHQVSIMTYIHNTLCDKFLMPFADHVRSSLESQHLANVCSCFWQPKCIWELKIRSHCLVQPSSSDASALLGTLNIINSVSCNMISLCSKFQIGCRLLCDARDGRTYFGRNRNAFFR